jgi:signal transduction histidine kinase/CheY-like chemotaxis protein
VYLRGPLKFGFTLTLSLIALLTLLIAVWAAIFFARRLATPIRELAEATHAVAQGDYQKQIPVTSHDELGILVESFNDMTHRIHRAQVQSKRSQQEAEIQRAYLETVLGHLSSGVLTFNQRLLLRTHNPAAAQILGADLRAGERKPLAWLAENYPALQPLIEAVEQAAAAGAGRMAGADPAVGQQPSPHPDAARHLAALLARPRGGYVVVFDDITTLIQAQRDAAWGEVARRMAHEIKNPLTPIQLSAERIRHKCLRQVAGGGARRARPRHAHDHRAGRIAQDHGQRFLRIRALGPDAVAPVDLNASSATWSSSTRGGAGVVPLHRGSKPARAKPPRRHHQTRSRRESPRIPADPGRLRQVLHNLLLNARDALTNTPRPVIRLGTRLAGENNHRFVELTVQDNGPGFPDALLARLYEPYVTHKEKGTGLGLAIVKRIVEEHGGSIRAYNLKEGGACVTIRLPVGTAATETPAVSRRGEKRRHESRLHPGGGRRTRHPPADAGNSRGRALQGDGGRERRAAREAVKKQRPDLVLLDIWMPGTDGISLLREWSEAGPLEMPVIMISGHGSVETAVEATRLGAYDFIEKPVSMGKLLVTIERALENDKLRRENLRLRRQAEPAATLTGKSALMQQLRENIERIAATDAWVLITGEPAAARPWRRATCTPTARARIAPSSRSA